MMNQILVTFMIFGGAMLVMSIGVMLGRAPLKGSCGGVGGNCPCADAGTPGACKIPAEQDDTQGSLKLHDQTEDGIRLYR